MVRLVIDEQQAQALKSGAEFIELATTDGRVVGCFRFQPIVPATDLSEEEARYILERARNSKRLWSTKQVLEHLSQLAPADAAP